MRAPKSLIATWALLLAACGSASGAQGVSWTSDVESAMEVARRSNRLVLLHFWDDGCPPCRRMEQDVFPRPDVAAAIERCYVPVKVKVRDHEDLANDCGVRRWPADIVLKPDGTIIHSTLGAKPADQYMEELSRVAATHRVAPDAALAGSRRTTPASPVAYGSPAYEPERNGYRPPNGPAGYAPPNRSAIPSPYAVGSWNQLAPGDDPRAGALPSARSHEPSGNFPPPERQATRVQGGHVPQPPYAPAPDHAPASPVDRRPYDMNREPREAVASARPDTAQIPPGNPPLGLDGYSPVWLADHEEWRRGDPRWGIRHAGRTYLFCGPEEQQRFFEDPERYAPIASGNDIVLLLEQGQAVPGLRRFGVWYGEVDSSGTWEGQIYLFSSRETADAFKSRPESYTAQWAARHGGATTARSGHPLGGRSESPSGRFPRM